MYRLDFDTGFYKRFQRLRLIVGKSRDYFERNFGFSANTLRSWESPNSGQRSFKIENLNNYIEIYEKYLGVVVTTEWLLYGIGNPPLLKEKILITSDATVDLLLDERPFFFLIDRNMLLRRINPFYSDILSDKPLTDIEGKHIEEILGRKTFKDYYHVFKDALEGRINRYPFYPIKSDKEDQKILINCKPALSTDKKIIGIFNFIEKGI
jgi:hypothetical protein